MPNPHDAGGATMYDPKQNGSHEEEVNRSKGPMPTGMVSEAQRDSPSEDDSGQKGPHEAEVNGRKEPMPTEMVSEAQHDVPSGEDLPDSPSKKSRTSALSVMSCDSEEPQPRCGRGAVSPCDDIDVRGIVGYRTLDANEEDHPSWMMRIRIEITQEIRVLLLSAVAGLTLMLPLLPSGWLRHGSTSGSSLGEHIPSLFLGLWLPMNFVGYWLPGLFNPELDSLWNYAIFNIFSVPCVLSLLIVPWADDFNTDNMIVHILYGPLVTFATPFLGTPILCAAMRVHGVKEWKNPLKFARNMKIYFPDAIALFFHFQACVLPSFWILFDILYFASGAAGDVVKQARPVLSICTKRVAYVMWGKSAERLGSSFKMFGIWQVGLQNSLMTMCGAIQCRSWRQLLIFMLVDWVAFLSRIWCLSGTLNSYKPFNLLRRFMVWGKPSPPPPLSKLAYRGYEIVVEGKCVTISLMTMIIFYPICKLTFKYDALARFVYPADDSLYFLCVFGISDIIQDQFAFKYVGYKTSYHFETFFAWRNVKCFLQAVGTNVWSLGMLTLTSTLAEAVKVGPFKDD